MHGVQQLRTSEGLEGLLEQVGASMAPGRQQALQVSRDHAKHSTERRPGGASVRVSSSTNQRQQYLRKQACVYSAQNLLSVAVVPASTMSLRPV